MAGVAHEIGNLLTVVSGWVQSWERTGASAPEEIVTTSCVYACLGRIRYALNRLSGPEAITTKNLTVVDINAVLRHSLSTLDPRVERGFKLTQVAEPDPWPVVGDFWALDFVLVNLVMDAVAASHPGSPVLVKTSNIETDTPIHGVGGSLAEGGYVSLSIHTCLDESGADSPRRDALTGPPEGFHTYEETYPLCLRILEEHGGLLQILKSPYGESNVAIFLPAVARYLRAAPVDGAPPEGVS
jgi:hypothetical protein